MSSAVSFCERPTAADFACDADRAGATDAGTPLPSGHLECASDGVKPQEISKMGWGGPRENSGGARPGAGRPRKLPAVAQPSAQVASWYCATVRPGREMIAASQLRTLGFPTYLPILVAVETRTDVVRAPMFPGYLFLGLGNLSEHRPFEAPELTGLLRQTDGTPVPVPQRLIDDLMRRSGQDGAIRLEAARETLLADTLATITEGPLAGLQAKVLTASRDWVTLLLHVLGRDVPTTLARHSVRAAEG